MPTWKQINESGGTYILRFICAVLALLLVYGAATAAVEGHVTFEKVASYLAGLVLFGGYAIFGNRHKTVS
jgi:hypothetical protein